MLAPLLPLFYLYACVYGQGRHLDDPSLFHFITRPDLQPPKWNLTVFNESALSPGYWFVAPKQAQSRTIGQHVAWTGPVIYDGSGEVVWAGTAQLDSSNIMDFRLSVVDGEHLMTMYDRDRRSGIFLDDHFRIRQVLDAAGKDGGVGVNGHEFQVVDGGKGVLVITNHREKAPERDKAAIGFKGDVCFATYNNFLELSIETGEVLFRFDPLGQIGLEESDTKDNINAFCRNTWDFMHANSIDKDDNGDYYFNARHTNTIYKISKDNGTILWRLGGSKSDFVMDGVAFSRQHDIKFRGQNKTHTFVSILDNALGEDPAPPTFNYSRGLLIALDTHNMVASLAGHYDNPDLLLAKRRGNMQILDNGNVFMGWSEHAQQSEHLPDGTPLMNARLAPNWLDGSYRNYKFPFVGRPLTRPDVTASVFFNGDATRVHVSWNGDTEVKLWKLYSTSADGKEKRLIASEDRKGFETKLESTAYASYVLVEGFDKEGDSVGKSHPIKTAEHPDLPDSSGRRKGLVGLKSNTGSMHETKQTVLKKGMYKELL